MVPSSSLDANRFTGNIESPSISWSLTVHYRLHNSPTMNTAHPLHSISWRYAFITLYLRLGFSFSFTHQNPLCISLPTPSPPPPLHPACHMSCQFQHPWFPYPTNIWSRSQYPRGLRRGSVATRLLRLCVRIPLWTWMFVCCGRCVLLSRGICDEMITGPEESYRMWCVGECDLETSWMRRPWPPGGCCAK